MTPMPATRPGRCARCQGYVPVGAMIDFEEDVERSQRENRLRWKVVHETCPPQPPGKEDLPSNLPGATSSSTSGSNSPGSTTGYSVSVEATDLDNAITVKLSRLYLTRQEVDAVAVDLIAVAKKVRS